MKKNRGFTIFEVTIAFFCLVLIAVPVAGVMIGQVRNQNDIQKGVINQQETARLVTRLTDDLRFSKLGIKVSAENLLVIHYDKNRFITYRYQGTPYIQRWESSTLSSATGAPPQNCGIFPDSSSGTTLEGGKFQYFDKSNVTLPYNKDQNKICAISLSGAKLGGSQGGSQVSIAIPPLTVANRYAIEANPASGPKSVTLTVANGEWIHDKEINYLRFSLQSDIDASFDSFALSDGRGNLRWTEFVLNGSSKQTWTGFPLSPPLTLTSGSPQHFELYFQGNNNHGLNTLTIQFADSSDAFAADPVVINYDNSDD